MGGGPAGLCVGERSLEVPVGVRGVRSGRHVQLQPHTPQQREQLLALGAAEIGAQLALEPHCDRESPPEQLVSGGGQVQLAGTSIVRVVPAFDQQARLQGIDEGDHAAGRDLQTLADRLLGLTLRGGDPAQQGELARLQLQRRERVAEARSNGEPDRGKSETDSLKRSAGLGRQLWRGIAVLGVHTTIISHRKDLCYRLFRPE